MTTEATPAAFVYAVIVLSLLAKYPIVVVKFTATPLETVCPYLSYNVAVIDEPSQEASVQLSDNTMSTVELGPVKFTKTNLLIPAPALTFI
jgi:hypothetical protein